MAEITCSNCFCRFDPEDYPLIEGAKKAGMATGALIGARIGMLAGPVGTVAGALAGGILSQSLLPKVCKCPCCDKEIKLDE